METSKKLHIIFQAILLLWLIAMSIILHWSNIMLFIVVFAISLIIIGPFVFYIIHDKVKYKEAIPKPAKIIWYINIGLVAVSLIINISLPTVKYENDKYIIDNKEYYTEYAQHTGWYPAKIGLPIGKLDRFSDNFLAALFGVSKVHGTSQDKDNNIMLVSDTMSEFGDFMLYRDDFDFPTLEIIEPDKIEIGEYRFYKIREILFNSRYGNTEDKEKIAEIMEMIVNRQAVNYDFSSNDKELLSSLDGKSFELGLYTQQIPGCVYSISVEREDWHYIMHLGKDESLDVTYAVYLLLSEGE